MRGKQRWLSLITIMLIFITGVDAVCGKQNGNTVVTYTPEISFHDLYVIVVGNGYVQDGSMEIRNGTNIYQMKLDDQKEFMIKADKGNRLKSIIFDGKDIKDKRKDDSLIITMQTKDIILIVTFEKDTPEVEKDVPVFVPEKPIPPIQEDETKDKEIISVITKTIPLEELRDGITDELIKSYIQSNANYKILSHNIQAKPGIYDVVIQFDDGTIRTVQIEVVDDNKGKEDVFLEDDPCYIHWLILIIGIMYIGYMGIKIHKNEKSIKAYKERISYLESWEDSNEEK